MKKILGISAFYHDSAAALSLDGKIIAAVQEERFTRTKHTSVFPVESIRYCLKHGSLSIDDLNAVVFYDKPFLKFERLLLTYYTQAPKGLKSFVQSMPVWMKEKIFLKREIYKGLKEIGHYERKKLNLLFTEHHLSHAASAFYCSSFENAAILTIDGVGEWATATICKGDENGIEILREMRFPHSVGLLYSAFTHYLGFRVNSGEYKLMGLAPYGDKNSAQTRDFIAKIKTHIIDLKEDGSVWLNQQFFKYSTGLSMTHDKNWHQLFGFERRLPDATLHQSHCNLAFAIQSITEEIVIKMARKAKRLTNSDYLCLAGGVALNSVANGKLIHEQLFKDIYIQPAAGDAGGAIGAALAAHHLYFDKPFKKNGKSNLMSSALLGPSYSNKEVESMNKRFRAVCRKFDDFKQLSMTVADLIHSGKVVGWFQGRMEFGPRALGNRSILADPSDLSMQKRINRKIKKREDFRPFAPAVLSEDRSVYFDMNIDSPFMLYVVPLKEDIRHSVPVDFVGMSMNEKMQYPKSVIPAVTHVDFSCRIQTVDRNCNPRFWRLITEFKKLSGWGLLLNTSFNVRGEPIVCSPQDAYKCFMRTDMDYLVINDFLYAKEDQAHWEESTDDNSSVPMKVIKNS